MHGLAAKATGAGVRILEGVQVTGLEFGHNSRARSPPASPFPWS